MTKNVRCMDCGRIMEDEANHFLFCGQPKIKGNTIQRKKIIGFNEYY